MALPKVLIFNQSFNKHSGGGITLSNLFSNWPKENLAVLCSGHMAGNLDPDSCEVYYQIGSEEHKWKFPFSTIQKKFTSGLLSIKKTEKDLNNPASLPGIRNKLVDTIFFPFLKFTGLFYSLSSINISESLKKWLTEYKPDILYIQVSERDAILFAQKLYQFLQIPMVVHIMDDWPSTIIPKGMFSNYWNKKIDQEFRQLLNACTLRMSISDDMAEEYESRYHQKFITFHNPINIDFWKQYQRDDYELGKIPTLLYAGRIGLGIDSSLELIARAVEKINAELNIPLKFVLQSHEKPSWFQNYSSLIHSSFIQYKDLPKKFSEADFLILPYDFSDESIKFIRLSMPTKAPEYMISGTPIFVFAPAITAIAKNAQKYNWAKIITQNDIDALATSIKDLLVNKSERKNIAETAKKFAEENFDLKKVTQKFEKILADLQLNFHA